MKEIIQKQATQKPITLQNYLEKKSKKHVTKGWRRHWYVLRGDVITYPKKYMKNSTEKEELLLQYHTVVYPAVPKYEKVYFKIVTSNKKYRFRCDDEKTADTWVTSCRAIVKQKSQTTVPLAADETILLEHAKKHHKFPSNHYEEHGTHGARNAKLEQVLGFEKLGVGEDKEKDKDYEQKFRANTDDEDKSARKGILSLDGGGLKGVLHAVVIERLCKQFPQLLDYIDCFAGTSGGAIIASALAAGYPPVFARQVLELASTTMFHKRAITKMGLAKYSAKWNKVTLEEISGAQRMNELPRKLVIPAFTLDNYNQFNHEQVRQWEPRILHNFGSHKLGETPVVDAVMRSLAAPSYFPSYQGYIDGGVFAHNPSMAAISLAMSPHFEMRQIQQVCVLSIGTGKVPRHLPSNDHENDWGASQWANKITDLLYDASADSTLLLAQTLLGYNFHRLDPVFTKDLATDDPSLVPVLSMLANELDLTATLNWLTQSPGAECAPAPAKPSPALRPNKSPSHRPSFTTPLSASAVSGVIAPGSPSKGKPENNLTPKSLSTPQDRPPTQFSLSPPPTPSSDQAPPDPLTSQLNLSLPTPSSDQFPQNSQIPRHNVTPPPGHPQTPKVTPPKLELNQEALTSSPSTPSPSTQSSSFISTSTHDGHDSETPNITPPHSPTNTPFSSSHPLSPRSSSPPPLPSPRDTTTASPRPLRVIGSGKSNNMRTATLPYRVQIPDPSSLTPPSSSLQGPTRSTSYSPRFSRTDSSPGLLDLRKASSSPSVAASLASSSLATSTPPASSILTSTSTPTSPPSTPKPVPPPVAPRRNTVTASLSPMAKPPSTPTSLSPTNSALPTPNTPPLTPHSPPLAPHSPALSPNTSVSSVRRPQTFASSANTIRKFNNPTPPKP